MYLLSAAQIAATVSGLKGESACSVPAQDTFDTLLTNILTRLEEALNVESIKRGVWRDHFRIEAASANVEVQLRLSNGFLTADDGVLIEDSEGTTLTVDHEVDRDKGLIFVSLPAGSYRATYRSGFTADVTTKVFENHPEWMQSIATAIMIQWVRLTSMGAVPKDVSYGALTSAMTREIATRVYQRYMRPRVGTVWSYRSARKMADGTVLPAAEE